MLVSLLFAALLAAHAADPEVVRLRRELTAAQSALDRLEESASRSGIRPELMPLLAPAGVAEWVRLARLRESLERQLKARLDALDAGSKDPVPAGP